MKWFHIFIFAIVALPFSLFAQQASSPQTYQGVIDKLLADQKDLLEKASVSRQSVTGDNLDVKISPTNPGANVPVRITIESYLTDLYKASISWSVDGKVILRGVGKTSFSFSTGGSGRTTVVGLSITTNGGELITRNFSFTPLGVTVLWEADTYTPAFYRGKALLSPQANVRLVALPDTTSTSFNDTSLVYVWKKDNYVDKTVSGYRKNVYSFEGPKPLTNTKISLDASTLDGTSQSQTHIYLPQVRPLVLFYENDPLLGVEYNKPLVASYPLSKKELSLRAEPYFFSNERGEAATNRYIWQINNKSVPNDGRDITLRNDEGQTGSSLISLSVRGITKTFQSAENKLRIDFLGDTTSRPIF